MCWSIYGLTNFGHVGFYEVLVARRGVAADELAQESSQEKHRAHHDEEHGYIEPNTVGEGYATADSHDAHNHKCNETQDE